MKKIVFHVGLPKTGTTFLQRKVFPKIKNITYYNCIDNKKGEDSIRLNPFFIQFGPGTSLVSDERICGLGYLKLPQGTMRERLIKLHIMHPNAEIIYVTRKEEDLMVSLYKQYAKYSYGYLSMRDWFREEADKNLIFQQYETMMYILRNFKNALIMDYSVLQKHPKEFIDTITDFLGAPRLESYPESKVHVSPSGRAIKSIVKLNNSKLPISIKKPVRYLWRKNV